MKRLPKTSAGKSVSIESSVDVSDQLEPTMAPFRGISADKFAKYYNLAEQTVYIAKEIPHPICSYDEVSQHGNQISISGNCAKREHEISIKIDDFSSLIRASATIEVLRATKQLKSTNGMSLELRTLLSQIHSGNWNPLEVVRAAGVDYARKIFKDHNLNFDDVNDPDVQNLKRMMEVGYFFSKLANAGILQDPSRFIRLGSYYDKLILSWIGETRRAWLYARYSLVSWEYSSQIEHEDYRDGGKYLPVFGAFKYVDLMIYGYSSLGLLNPQQKDFIQNRKDTLNLIASTPIMTREQYGKFLSTLPLWSKTSESEREWISNAAYKYYQSASYIKVEARDRTRWPLCIGLSNYPPEYEFNGLSGRIDAWFEEGSYPTELYNEFKFVIPKMTSAYDMEFLLQEIVRLGLATLEEANANRFWPKPA